MPAASSHPSDDDRRRALRKEYARAFDVLVAGEVECGRIAVAEEPGREFLYRPGQLLTPTGDADQVLAMIRDRFPDLAGAVRVESRSSGVARITFDDASAPIPRIVSALRDPRTWGEGPLPWVQPHHVTVGYPRIMGNPQAPPTPPVDKPTPPDPALADAGRGVTVGICDTGIWAEASTAHVPWFAGRYRHEADDIDQLSGPTAPAGSLSLQAGHGTFVAGVLRETAPGVRIDPEVALDPDGLGDEETLARALEALEPGAEVINLSLGCVTMDNMPSLPIWVQIQRLCRDRVVVAAAGNAGDRRPRWPAAFKQVIAVAAVELDPESGVRPDPDSSHGPWVDACAPGTWTTTFVRGTTAVGAVHFADPFATWAGTSFAAPVVAGRICELMTRHGIGAREAARRLLDRPRWHPDYGVLVP